MFGNDFRTKIELLRGRKWNIMLREQDFQVIHSAFEVVDVRSRDLPLGEGVKSHALNAGLFARQTRGQLLIAAVFTLPASIAG